MPLRNFTDYMAGRGQQFQAYGAGNKRYGPSGRAAPNIGPVGDRSGYKQRDLQAQLRRNAMLARLQAGQKTNYMSKAYLSPTNQTRTF